MNPLAPTRRWMTPLHALLLAGLLLAAQGLGLAHRVAHPAPLEALHAAVGSADEWLDGHQEGAAECRLVDQLGHADLAFGLASAPVACAAGSSASAIPAATAPRAAPAALYLARGPPLRQGPAA